MTAQVQTSPNRVPLLWGVALVVSLMLHAGLLQLNPSVLSGSGGAGSSVPARTHPVIDVRPPEPDRLREELPRLFDRLEDTDLSQDVSVMESPEIPDLSGGATEEQTGLPELQTSVAPAALQTPDVIAPESGEWSPREEVLAVIEPRVQEVLEVMPRSFREVETTRPGAPDITLPAEMPDALSDIPTMSGAPLPLSFEVGRPAVPEPPEPLPGPLVSPRSGSLNNAPDLPALESFEIPDEEEIIATEQLLQLRVQVYDPPDEPEARYFKIQLKRNGIESLPVMPRDIVYLVDCSASMTERKLRIALRGIRSSLKPLTSRDRIQVIAFRESLEWLAPEPLPASVFGKAQVRTFLSTLHAYGQTDVFASLEALQDIPDEEGRPVQAVLVTDGVPTQGVMDTGKILDAFTRRNDGRISVFGLGGGDRVNRQLLDFLSFRNRGSSLISSREYGLAKIIPEALAEVRRPVLTDLQVRFTGDTSPDMYPKSVSHLYVDRPWILIGRTDRFRDRMAFQVVGRSENARHDILFELELNNHPQGSRSLQTEWAWQAGLEKWAAALEDGSPEAFDNAATFFRNYELEVPEAYQN